MKRSPVWAVAVALFALASQSMAGPVVSIKEPEGVVTETFIKVDGYVKDSQEFYWESYEGEGNLEAVTEGTDAQGHAIIIDPGFQQFEAIAWEQNFSAGNGRTVFYRSFAFNPTRAPNLHVKTDITFQGDPFAGSSLANYEERVGLAAISTGGDATFLIDNDSGLLSLCPWASATGRDSRGGDPAASLSVAAGSSFNVTNIVGFSSEATVVRMDNPLFKYSVDTKSGGGQGVISAWFAVDLWEGTAKWGSHDIGICNCSQFPTGIYAIDDPVAVQSRTSYSEDASASGVWTFMKNVSYRANPKIDPMYLVLP